MILEIIIDNGIAMEFVLDFLLIQLKGNGIVAVEVKLALKRKV